ncbi:MAG: protein kinase, partial [Gammaproteobacteria bacterium]|nr:protein kinase [Gammaproteobacteria bacterium]
MNEKTLGNFRIVEPIGKGGMGVVVKAVDERLGRSVALKILPPEFAADDDRRARFEREARAAANLSHPNITQIFDVGNDDGTSYIAMEFVEGETLAARIQRGAIGIGEIVAIAAQIVDALDEAHRAGIIHRDIKPANVMVTPSGRVKVLDFGLAKSTSSLDQSASEMTTQMQTETGAVLGTVHYMSPEQALGKNVDGRSDIFSLGVVLYEMATGTRPFSGDTATETIDKISHAQPEAIARFN